MRGKKDKVHIKITPKMLAFGVLLVWVCSLFGTWMIAQDTLSKKLNNNSFPLLNPRLKTYGLDTPEERDAKLFATLTPLKTQLLGDLGQNKDNVAFYVEDLNTGGWMGWKERDPFIAASLLKVPIAIGAMKKVDRGEWTLSTAFAMESKYRDDKFGDLWKEPDGTQISVERLMKEMLQKSDNTAVAILLDKISVSERDDVFYHIGMANPESAGERPTFTELSPKDLATMFRALYNSTYLTRKSSTYILDLLTKTEFEKTISTAIPKDVRVAHKIGNFLVPNYPKNYHDCGITYLHEHPYLYCTMTKGFDAEPAEKIITDIGYKVYAHFEEGRKNK